MITEIMRKFNIMLTIPVICIITLFIITRPEPEYVVLKYHPETPYINIEENQQQVKTYIQTIKQTRLISYNIMQEATEVSEIYNDIQESINLKQVVQEPQRVVSSNIYFTEEQQKLIPSNYTLDEVRMLCTMVYGECGAITGDVLVTHYDENNNVIKEEYKDASYMHKTCASVLLNRVEHNAFPDTIYDNLVAPRQYNVLYTYESQSYDYYSGVGSNWKNIVNEVIDVLNGNFKIPDNVVFQSNFSSLGSSYFTSIYVDTGYFRSTSYYAFE